MKRKAHICLAFAAAVLTGCAGRPFSIAGAVCSDRDGPNGPVRICETATQVVVEQEARNEDRIVARDPEPRLLGLTEGAAADRIIASARGGRPGRCSIDRRALKETLARQIARKLLDDI